MLLTHAADRLTYSHTQYGADSFPTFNVFIWFPLVYLLAAVTIDSNYESSSSWSCHGVGPLVGQFQSHLSRSLMVLPESSCLLVCSFSVSWEICYGAFCLHVVSSFSCTSVFCPKLGLHLILSNLCICLMICPSVSCCYSQVFHLCCCYSSWVSYLNVPVFTAL
jgi:hypothetical protein